MERRNKTLAVLLAALLLTTVAVAFFTNRDDTAVAGRDRFLLRSAEGVDRVVLASSKDTVTLAFNGSSWRVNDRYVADPGMVKVLFATLLQQEVRRPVGRRLNDSLVRTIPADGVRVSVFSGDEAVKIFYAAGNSSKTRAYFMEAGSDEVFVMNIPGYRVYVSGIYELDEGGFRDKYVFAFPWQNFRKLTMKFPGRNAENFTVVPGEDHFGIAGLAAVDTARLNTFLDNVSLLTVETYLSTPVDTLQPRIAEITIEDIAGRQYPLILFRGEDPDMVPALARGEAVLFRRERIQAVLRPRSFFRKQ